MNERLKIDRKTYQFMDKRYTKKQTLDVLIERREWVPGGMQELMDMMLESFSYFDSLVAFSCYQPLTCHQYSWALGYALASMWVMAYNARSGAIEIMTMSDYHKIEKEQFYLANQFKTSNIYSYQIVNTTDVVDLYVKYLRRHVIPADVDSEEAVLFPTWKGTPLSQGEASKKISSIFRTYGYNLSVTRLRGIISTHVEERFRKDEITLEQYQRFITTGQTHTIATHKKFYAKKRKYEGSPPSFHFSLFTYFVEGQLLQESYDKIFPTAPIIHDYYDSLDPTTVDHAYMIIAPQQQSNEFSSSEYYLPADCPSTPLLPYQSPPTPFSLPAASHRHIRLVDEGREFGFARSDINDKKKKFDWLQEEIDYLVEYIQKIAPELPGASKNRYATCLSFLKQSAPAEAIQYFHPHHLMTSDRLKNGYLRALQTIEEGGDGNGSLVGS